MSFHDFYHKFFGDKFGGYIRPPEGDGDDEDNVPNRQKDPFWSQDRNEDREFPSFFHFNIVTDPIEMHRFFEHKMNEIMSSLFSPSVGFPGFYGFSELEPPNESAAEENKSLRDHYLKPGINKPQPNDGSSGTTINDPWRGSGSWLDSFKPNQEIALDDSPARPKIYSSFRSVIRKSVTLPDGTVKTEEIIRDSDGTESKTESISTPDEDTGALDSSPFPFQFSNISDFFNPSLPELNKSPRDEYLKPGYENPISVGDKVDKDLDYQIQEKGIKSLPSLLMEAEPTEPSDQAFSFKSVIRRSIMSPNGEVETEEIVRNSDGSEERSITRTLPEASNAPATDSLWDGLFIAPHSNHNEELKNPENYSNLMKGIDIFMKSFFR